MLLVGLLALSAAFFFFRTRTDPIAPLRTRAPAADVEAFEKTCRDDAGVGRLQLGVFNTSRVRTDYVIEVSFLDRNGKAIGEGIAVMRRVKAGDTARVDALGTLIDDSTLASCRLGTVSRIPSV